MRQGRGKGGAVAFPCCSLVLLLFLALPTLGVPQAYQEKEDGKKLKSKQRDKMQPKMGKMDIDYQVLHDAFFKYQTKPKLTYLGDVYYEGKEFEVRGLLYSTVYCTVYYSVYWSVYSSLCCRLTYLGDVYYEGKELEVRGLQYSTVYCSVYCCVCCSVYYSLCCTKRKLTYLGGVHYEGKELDLSH